MYAKWIGEIDVELGEIKKKLQEHFTDGLVHDGIPFAFPLDSAIIVRGLGGCRAPTVPHEHPPLINV